MSYGGELQTVALTGVALPVWQGVNEDFGDGLKRPSVIETDSPLYKGYKSVMIYAKIRKKEMADEIFTLNALPRIEELR